MGAIALHSVRRLKFLTERGCVWMTSRSRFANRRRLEYFKHLWHWHEPSFWNWNTMISTRQQECLRYTTSFLARPSSIINRK